jgi:hypothetical protein
MKKVQDRRVYTVLWDEDLEREHENPSFKTQAVKDERENRSIRKQGTMPQTAVQNQERKNRGLKW